MSVANPSPAITAPLGVHGSIIRILTAGMSDSSIRNGAPALAGGVNFDLRPAQLSMYPAINVRSGGTREPMLTFEQGKNKPYVVIIEVFGRDLEEAELLGEAVERMLETTGPEDAHSAVLQIASMTASDPDGVAIEDLGDERYETEPEWGPGAKRSVRGTLRYLVTIMRSF